MISMFPITCLDNFYKDPDKIREFALSCEYKKHEGSNYPGLRTDPIHLIENEFFNDFCMKLFALFYDYEYHLVDWVVESYFQKIDPYSEDNESLVNTGWCHLDEGYVFAGVIYLNPESHPDAGTSFYDLKNKDYHNLLDYDLRNKLYRGEEVDIGEYEKSLEKHNTYFEKTIEFKNKYNRLICYNGWHKENNFVANNNEPRLTQVFFVKEVIADNTPVERSMISKL